MIHTDRVRQHGSQGGLTGESGFLDGEFSGTVHQAKKSAVVLAFSCPNTALS